MQMFSRLLGWCVPNFESSLLSERGTSYQRTTPSRIDKRVHRAGESDGRRRRRRRVEGAYTRRRVAHQHQFPRRTLARVHAERDR